jgi:hypothetical protein
MTDPSIPLASPHVRLPLADAGRARRARRPFELTAPGDVFCDYTLVPYDPVRSPEGKLRAVNLLVESFALAGVEDEGYKVIELLRQGLGPHRTVFGIKFHAPDHVAGWELYFYDPRRERQDLSIERVIEILAPALPIDARPPRPLPWHMFSVEFDATHLRGSAKAAVDVYISTNPHAKGTDRSYKLRAAELTFENVYSFHRPLFDIDEILYRIQYGVFFSRAEFPLSAVIPPELFRCGHICVANKRHADALYFSRITIEQLRFAMKFFGWRGELPEFLDSWAPSFDHLLWDIGFDFVVDEGRIRFLKGGIYGSF